MLVSSLKWSVWEIWYMGVCVAPNKKTQILIYTSSVENWSQAIFFSGGTFHFKICWFQHVACKTFFFFIKWILKAETCFSCKVCCLKNVIRRIWGKFVNMNFWEAMAKDDDNTCFSHYFLVNLADTYNLVVCLEDPPVC